MKIQEKIDEELRIKEEKRQILEAEDLTLEVSSLSMHLNSVSIFTDAKISTGVLLAPSDAHISILFRSFSRTSDLNS